MLTKCPHYGKVVANLENWLLLALNCYLVMIVMILLISVVLNQPLPSCLIIWCATTLFYLLMDEAKSRLSTGISMKGDLSIAGDYFFSNSVVKKTEVSTS